MSQLVAQPEPSGRDASSGRFTAGNSFGKKSRRRPRKEIEAEYLEAFSEGCPSITLKLIVEKVAERALSGNLEACKLLLRYAMPSSNMRLELAADDEEYRVAGQSPAEGMYDMWKRIERKVMERRKYEAANLEAFKGRNN